MSRIYWDSMLFIYWLENHPRYAGRVDAVFTRMRERGDQLITSAFTFGEVLAGAWTSGGGARAADLRRMLQSVVAEVIPFTAETADIYAQLRGSSAQVRGTSRVTPADAIHLASAAQAGTDLFLTNDRGLLGKFIPGIQFIATLDTPLL